jgi:copper ion binding protein
MEKVTFEVQNISCGHCVKTIEMELGELAGVEKVDADQDSKHVKVSFESPATEESLRELLADINYPAS